MAVADLKHEGLREIAAFLFQWAYVRDQPSITLAKNSLTFVEPFRILSARHREC